MPRYGCARQFTARAGSPSRAGPGSTCPGRGSPIAQATSDMSAAPAPAMSHANTSAARATEPAEPPCGSTPTVRGEGRNESVERTHHQPDNSRDSSPDPPKQSVLHSHVGGGHGHVGGRPARLRTAPGAGTGPTALSHTAFLAHGHDPVLPAAAPRGPPRTRYGRSRPWRRPPSYEPAAHSPASGCPPGEAPGGFATGGHLELNRPPRARSRALIACGTQTARSG